MAKDDKVVDAAPEVFPFGTEVGKEKGTKLISYPRDGKPDLIMTVITN